MRKHSRIQKPRHEIAIQRFASPRRDAAPRDLEDFWHERHKYDRARNLVWDDAGPSNFSGRVTCLAADPKNPKLLYAGSAGGGLWKTEDAGERWTSCWPHSVSQNIGAVAIHPDVSSRIICATGEGNFATASYPGSGIYQSEDGGFTWRSYLYQPGWWRMTAQDRDSMPRRVACISFSARDSKGNRRTAFGSISNDEDLLGGLYWNKDPGDGSSQRMIFEPKWSDRPYNCYSAVFHPEDPDTLFVSIEAGGSVNGIWRTTNGGTTWLRLSAGLPPGELCGRISLAISPSDPEVLFALISSRPTASLQPGIRKGQRVLGVFSSNSGGDKWSRCDRGLFQDQGHLEYNNTIAIHPRNPKMVVCGAQHLMLTEDGGKSWANISQEVHADHHAIVIGGGEKPGRDVIYSANDGGVDVTRDLGKTWRSAHRGMSTVMLYAIDVSPANGQIYGGGTQDNGTLLAGVNEDGGRRRRGDLRFTRVLAGDGGYLVFDPTEEELVFGSLFGTQTSFHEPGTPWERLSWQDASPPVPQAEREVLGLTVMAIKAAVPARKQPRELYLGTNRLWRATFKKPNRRSKHKKWVWRTAGQNQFDGSAISAIEFARTDPSMMFVGTAQGGIYRSRDGGRRWSEDLAGPEIPNRVITQIETHPINVNEVVVTVASSTAAQIVLSGVPKPHSKVFRSRDAGESWEDIDQGALPNVVFNGLEFELDPPYRIFVGGDAGPWVWETDGRWVSIAGDMPSAVISELVYHQKTKTLFAGTYGRGIWRLKVPRRFKIVQGVQRHDSDALLPPIEGFQLCSHHPVPIPLTPGNGEHLSGHPGGITLTCGRVKDAAGYIFEVIRDGDASLSQVKSSRTPTVTIQLAGSGGGGGGRFTWRCWALWPDSLCSAPSQEVRFRYRV